MPKRLMHDPRDFHIPESGGNKLTPDEISEMRELVFRRWPPFLSGPETKIVMFIYDRTIHYSKRWEYVSIETLLHGFPLADYRNVAKIAKGNSKFYRNLTAKERTLIGTGDHMLTAPTGLGRRQIIYSLQDLERRGFIYRITNNGLPEIALNPDAHFDYIEYLINRQK